MAQRRHRGRYCGEDRGEAHCANSATNTGSKGGNGEDSVATQRRSGGERRRIQVTCSIWTVAKYNDQETCFSNTISCIQGYNTRVPHKTVIGGRYGNKGLQGSQTFTSL